MLLETQKPAAEVKEETEALDLLSIQALLNRRPEKCS
jgi:hypothetical protein